MVQQQGVVLLGLRPCCCRRRCRRRCRCAGVTPASAKRKHSKTEFWYHQSFHGPSSGRKPERVLSPDSGLRTPDSEVSQTSTPPSFHSTVFVCMVNLHTNQRVVAVSDNVSQEWATHFIHRRRLKSCAYCLPPLRLLAHTPAQENIRGHYETYRRHTSDLRAACRARAVPASPLRSIPVVFGKLETVLCR
jgi:hypothetical protein